MLIFRSFLLTFFVFFLTACGAGSGVSNDIPDSAVGNDAVSNNNNNNGNENTNSNSNSNPVCGNGNIEEGEICDDGAANSDTEPNACRTTCTLPSCGDGVVDDDEACDDSNLGGSTCASEGFTAGLLSCASSCELDFTNCTTCGNGVAEGSDPAWPGYEVCDGTDLRSLSCTDFGLPAGVLACSACTWNTSGCVGAATCGNGTVEAWEGCDDGNTTPCDGCSSTCQVEECGNGVVECSETCDDANSSNEDACLNICVLNTCGDGYINVGVETCDDGNNNVNDACPDGPAGTCQITTCGDGFTNLNTETCDDGNGNNEDACPDGVGGTCLAASCGDGFVQTGVENCDPGLDPICNGDCTGSCGDGVWNSTYEICDPSVSGHEMCNPDCAGYCGDGILRSQWEDCDPGISGGPPCFYPECTLSVCGDGICDWNNESHSSCPGDCPCSNPTDTYCGGQCWPPANGEYPTCCSDGIAMYNDFPGGYYIVHCGDCSITCSSTQDCVSGQCV